MGIVEPHRIVVGGTSRGGYMAFRLPVSEPRIVKAAVFAPVTNWNDLSEFADQKDAESVNRLRLSNYTHRIFDKLLYMLIGYHDKRVSTLSCCKFYDRWLCDGHAEASSPVKFIVHLIQVIWLVKICIGKAPGFC